MDQNLELSQETYASLWRQVVELCLSQGRESHSRPVEAELSGERAEELLGSFSFAQSREPAEVLDFVSHGLASFRVDTTNPAYFGLFNPAPTAMGVLADTLVAAFNPQLASWNHGSFAIAVESHLVRRFAAKFDLPKETADGTFCSGGAEANHTAVLAALTHRFPEFSELGVRGLEGRPMMYTSREGHHSVLKAARACGLGSVSLVEIPVDDSFRLSLSALEAQMERDLKEGRIPFLVVGTAGTTSGGIVDPLEEIAEIARRFDAWFHVDAAWGGAGCFVPELRHELAGIELANSITFDTHKWMSVPMGAGLFLTREKTILSKTFDISTAYMPAKRDDPREVDPYSGTSPDRPGSGGMPHSHP